MARTDLGKTSFMAKGNHDSTVTYEKLDMVRDTNGSSYIAKQAVPAGTLITDTDYWQKVVSNIAIGTVSETGPGGAAASMGGTPDAPVLNLTLPRGVAGNESIDDTAGEGDTDKVWSADKCFNEIYTKLYEEPFPLLWESGAMQGSTGTTIGNAKRLRTKAIRYFPRNAYGVKAKTGYEFFVLAYDKSDYSYVGHNTSSGTWSTGGTNVDWVQYFVLDPQYGYRICAKRIDDGDMSVSEGDNFIFILSYALASKGEIEPCTQGIVTGQIAKLKLAAAVSEPVTYVQIYSSGDPTVSTNDGEISVSSRNSNVVYRSSPLNFNASNTTGQMFAIMKYEVTSVTGNPTLCTEQTTSLLDLSVGTDKYLAWKSKNVTHMPYIEFRLASGDSVTLKVNNMILLETDSNLLTTDSVLDVVKAKGLASNSSDISEVYYIYTPYELDLSTRSKWYGKKLVTYGDSNTAKQRWQSHVIRKFGMTLVNLGHGGDKAPDGADPTLLAQIPSDVDVITIMYGTNDANAGVSVGALPNWGIDETYTWDTTTYTGALCKIISYVQTNYPNCQIILCAPLFRSKNNISSVGGEFNQMNEYVNACEEIAKRFGCQFVNTYRDMGMSIYNYKGFMDNETWAVHLNPTTGGQRFAKLIINKLQEIEPVV